MNIRVRQFKIYVEALIAEINKMAKGIEQDSMLVSIRHFDEVKSMLNSAVITAKMLGVDVKIAYTEPTYYYSTLSLVSVQ